MKTILYVDVHSFVDVITNSSTELFVGSSNTKDALLTMIKEIYPEYFNEYCDLRTLDELDDDEIYTFLGYTYDRWSNQEQKMVHDVIDGFTFEEMYEQFSWNDEKGSFYIRDTFVNDHREKIIDALDPKRKMFFLFSIDQNPNWEMQEKLMMIMSRYHLG